jgi:hypothetical protein
MFPVRHLDPDHHDTSTRVFSIYLFSLHLPSISHGKCRENGWLPK